jgi:hypothetical protein
MKRVVGGGLSRLCAFFLKLPRERIFSARSARRSAQHIHKFGNLAALLVGITTYDCVLDAMRDVLAQDFFLDTFQRRAHSRDLRDDVDAVTILLDHAR